MTVQDSPEQLTSEPKPEIEYGFREREIAVKEREQRSREQEVDLKREELRRSRWSSPLVLALLGATVAALGNAVVAWYNASEQQRLESVRARENRELEQTRSEAQRILEAIRTGDYEKATANLKFLIQAGLVSDHEGRIQKAIADQKPVLPAAAQSTAAPAAYQIFDNTNIGGVLNEPSQPTRFRIYQEHYITDVFTYHWNGGLGKPGGQISLKRSEDGAIFGPWPVFTSSGQGDSPNVNWSVKADARIPAGTYEVRDSDPKTWSHNRESGNSGFTRIRGYPIFGGP